MAKRERDRESASAAFDLSDADVDWEWQEILNGFRPPKGRATAVWDALGEDYKSLGDRSS